MLDTQFPNLRAKGFSFTSPETAVYNCIAWAAGENNRWWWPDDQYLYYWPPNVPRTATLDAFIQAFGLLGYKACNSCDLEVGKEKIALYALLGVVTHASRQLLDGKWTSKLGTYNDISHAIDGLDGPAYGAIVQLLSRDIPTSPEDGG